MYNAKQKDAFLKSIKNKAKRIFAHNMFENIASYESAQNADICSLNPDDYPKILMQNNDIQRLTQLYSMISVLENYRIFCFGKRLMDPTVLMYYDAKRLKDAERGDMIVECFNENCKAVQFRTPDECYNYLVNEVFIKYKELPLENMMFWAPTLEDLMFAQVMFTYYGLSQEDISMIEIDNVNFPTTAIAHIRTNDKNVIIEGKFVELIRKLTTVRCTDEILIFGKAKIVRLHSQYLMALETEDSSQERLLRARRNYVAFAKRCTVNDVNFPTMKNLRYQGTIYRMAQQELLALSKDYLDWNLREWVEVYEFHDNHKTHIEKMPHYLAGTDVWLAKDIKNAFNVEYNFLAKQYNKKSL